ncbi:MAG: DUF4126 domain-containing protein [Methylococcales bacterium]|nr:DUF4126 domain-containing protein [Methylococcales bacterium]
MEGLEQLSATLALTMGVAWASGINLYAAIVTLGLLSYGEQIHLPPNLDIVANPWVIGAAGLMYVIEFFADKIPGVDTAWDGIHTFIRIPAGALLAAAAVGDISPAMEVAAGIVGGGLATGTHATKAGTRVLINTSPEPFTNWGASIGEDVTVIGGIWLCLNQPVLFLALLVVFILFMIWLLPKIWTGIKKVFRFIFNLFGGHSSDEEHSSTPPPR